MKKFELQTPISQLFNALKSLFFLRVSFCQIGCSKQSNKTHNFRKIFFFDVITLELTYGLQELLSQAWDFLVVPQNLKTCKGPKRWAFLPRMSLLRLWFRGLLLPALVWLVGSGLRCSALSAVGLVVSLVWAGTAVSVVLRLTDSTMVSSMMGRLLPESSFTC